jgi:hypothetical protein
MINKSDSKWLSLATIPILGQAPSSTLSSLKAAVMLAGMRASSAMDGKLSCPSLDSLILKWRLTGRAYELADPAYPSGIKMTTVYYLLISHNLNHMLRLIKGSTEIPE